jgi:Colon cancer-associated protein Mic1-like
MFKIT